MSRYDRETQQDQLGPRAKKVVLVDPLPPSNEPLTSAAFQPTSPESKNSFEDLDLLYRIGLLLAVLTLLVGGITVAKERELAVFDQLAQVFNLDDKQSKEIDHIQALLSQQAETLKQTNSFDDPLVFAELKKQIIQQEYNIIFAEVPDDSQQFQLMEKVWALALENNNPALRAEIIAMIEADGDPENQAEEDFLLLHLYLQGTLAKLYADLETANLVAGLLNDLHRTDLSAEIIKLSPYVEPIVISQTSFFVQTAIDPIPAENPAAQNNSGSSMNQAVNIDIQELITQPGAYPEQVLVEDQVPIPVFFRLTNVRYAFPISPNTNTAMHWHLSEEDNTFSDEDGQATLYQNTGWATISSIDFLKSIIQVLKPSRASIISITDLGNGNSTLNLKIAGFYVDMTSNMSPSGLDDSKSISIDMLLRYLE